MTEQSSRPLRPPRGCLFYSLILSSVLLLLVLVVGLIGLRMLRNMVNRYTDTQPVALPTVQISASDLEALQKRVAEFREALKAGKPASVLELTTDQANALIQNSPDLSPLRNRVYVQFKGGQIDSQLSLPLDSLGVRALKGRYLNGKATLAVVLDAGHLNVTPQMIFVKGKPLPEIYLRRIRHQNFAAQFNSEPASASALGQVDKIRVESGKLVVIPKGQ